MNNKQSHVDNARVTRSRSLARTLTLCSTRSDLGVTQRFSPQIILHFRFTYQRPYQHCMTYTQNGPFLVSMISHPRVREPVDARLSTYAKAKASRA